MMRGARGPLRSFFHAFPSRNGSGPTFDVAFYIPAIGSLLSPMAPPRGGGAETQVYILARALARRGLRVAVISHPTESHLPADVDGVHVLRRAPAQGHRRWVGALLEALLIAHAVHKADARVYVQRVAEFSTGIVAIATRLRRARFVFSSASISDFQLEGSRSRRDRLLCRLGIGLADAVVVQTNEQARLCETHLHRHPVVIASVAESAEMPATGGCAFLWVGRADDCKRPLDFVSLAREVPEAQFRMVLLREGESAERVAAAVEGAAAGVRNLEILGGLPRSELGRLMDQAVAIVSTSEYEGMPNVFLEGWARGIPALVLRHDPDGVVEREGLGASASGSFSALVNEVRSLWSDTARREALAVRCRAYVTERHSPESVANAWLEVLAPLHETSVAVSSID